jgi:hypothetical protein
MRDRRPGEVFKIGTVKFEYNDQESRQVDVVFTHRQGKPHSVAIRWHNADGSPGEHLIDNAKGEYKPCATHARQLFALASREPPKGEVDRRRRRAAKPVLKIMEE